jgi:hypothetical protein
VTRDFAPLQVLIVEGTYVLMLDDLDVRVFLEATHEDTHERRMARNRDIWEPIIDTILGIEHRLIAPQGATGPLAHRPRLSPATRPRHRASRRLTPAGEGREPYMIAPNTSITTPHARLMLIPAERSYMAVSPWS